MVDDEAHIRTFLAKGLNAAGYGVKVSSGVVDALSLLGWPPRGDRGQGWKPDLLITDWKMPSYDGAEFLYLLRTNPWFGDLPVIMLGQRSPLYDPAGYLEALPWRAQGYVYKPFSLPDLISLVERILDEPKE